ncbi:hypothetical protein LCGC14_2092300 [marine sediment metagenome]|uniref:Uncharacterized protein n=1 Tax=marine sediment metagenome TaxID=412755 RepID=A0A0F9ECJ8_9ZZZZ
MDYSDAQTVVVADWDPGQTWVQFVVPETFEIQPGQVITLIHSTTTKTHTVTNLTVTDVDPDSDIVVGTADPDGPITVWACDESECVFRYEAADGSGGWIADFGNPGDEPGEDIFDIGPGTSVDAYEHDDDGDATAVQWRVPNHRFNVYVTWNAWRAMIGRRERWSPSPSTTLA